MPRPKDRSGIYRVLRTFWRGIRTLEDDSNLTVTEPTSGRHFTEGIEFTLKAERTAGSRRVTYIITSGTSGDAKFSTFSARDVQILLDHGLIRKIRAKPALKVI